MGQVVVVVVVFKTYLNISRWLRLRRQGFRKGSVKRKVYNGRRDPTPKKVLYAKSAPKSDSSCWQGVKTFFGVGSPNIKGSNPEESFIREVSTRQYLCLSGLGKVSRLSSLDPRISRDPTPKKVLYAKSGPMSDRS